MIETSGFRLSPGTKRPGRIANLCRHPRRCRRNCRRHCRHPASFCGNPTTCRMSCARHPGRGDDRVYDRACHASCARDAENDARACRACRALPPPWPPFPPRANASPAAESIPTRAAAAVTRTSFANMRFPRFRAQMSTSGSVLANQNRQVG